MATGDRATEAGLPLVSGAGFLSDMDEYENQTRDMVAEVMLTRARLTVSATAPTSPQVGDLWAEPI